MSTKYYFVTVEYRDGEREYYAHYPMAAKLDIDDALHLAEAFIELGNQSDEVEASLHGFQAIDENEYKVTQKLIFDISEEYMRDALKGAE